MKKPRNNRSGINSALVVVVFATAFLACGCRKSARETAEENAIKRHEQEVAHGGPPRVSMSNFIRTPEGIRIMGEGAYLRNLLTNGQLPGVSKDVNGYFRFEKKILDVTPDGGCSQEVHFLRLTNSPFYPDNYHYIISRASSNSPWQLKKAWHTDQSSNVVQEFPVQ